MMGPCEAKIRPMPNDTEIECGLISPHDRHVGVLKNYAYPGSVTNIVWEEDDRRNFRGKWVPCEVILPRHCTLPAGHHGKCAP